jgi:hypothetical protein
MQSVYVAEYMCEVITLNDSHGLSNNDIIEYIMTQGKVRGIFSKLTKGDSHKLVQSLSNSVKGNNTFEN